MPVVDGVFIPTVPLAPAEHAVDWVSHHDTIIDRRRVVEKQARSAARRIAYAQHEFGYTPPATRRDLIERLKTSLDVSTRFGYREAQREIRAMRAQRPVTAAYVIPNPGRLSRIAALGLAGIRLLTGQRSEEAADAIIRRLQILMTTAEYADADQAERLALILATADRALHNTVLELVGETINMGRTAGALTAAGGPPTFALRSEQLDKAGCAACARIHGAVVEVGSSEYYRIMPPTLCFGGGRCRGLYVFSDGPQDVRLPEHLVPVPDYPQRKRAA